MVLERLPRWAKNAVARTALLGTLAAGAIGLNTQTAQAQSQQGQTLEQACDPNCDVGEEELYVQKGSPYVQQMNVGILRDTDGDGAFEDSTYQHIGILGLPRQGQELAATVQNTRGQTVVVGQAIVLEGEHKNANKVEVGYDTQVVLTNLTGNHTQWVTPDERLPKFSFPILSDSITINGEQVHAYVFPTSAALYEALGKHDQTGARALKFSMFNRGPNEDGEICTTEHPANLEILPPPKKEVTTIYKPTPGLIPPDTLIINPKITLTTDTLVVSKPTTHKVRFYTGTALTLGNGEALPFCQGLATTRNLGRTPDVHGAMRFQKPGLLIDLNTTLALGNQRYIQEAFQDVHDERAGVDEVRGRSGITGTVYAHTVLTKPFKLLGQEVQLTGGIYAVLDETPTLEDQTKAATGTIGLSTVWNNAEENPLYARVALAGGVHDTEVQGQPANGFYGGAIAQVNIPIENGDITITGTLEYGEATGNYTLIETEIEEPTFGVKSLTGRLQATFQRNITNRLGMYGTLGIEHTTRDTDIPGLYETSTTFPGAAGFTYDLQ